MKKDIILHSVQSQILKSLIFKAGESFNKLNENKISTDSFTFHLKSLVEAGLVKQENSRYFLTPTGKEFANRLDVEKQNPQMEKQAKIGVLICPVKKEKNQTEYLIQQRLKQPFFGYHGFMTGKIKWGEVIEEAAIRELQEETNLTACLSLKGIKHKMDYTESGALLEDKYFFVFKAENCKGDLAETINGGKNFWLTKKEIFALPNQFHGIEETIDMVSKNKLVFSESKYIVSGY